MQRWRATPGMRLMRNRWRTASSLQTTEAMNIHIDETSPIKSDRNKSCAIFLNHLSPPAWHLRLLPPTSIQFVSEHPPCQFPAMVVRMRLRPTGLRNNPSFDVVVTRNPLRPTAAPIEKLGEYLPVPSVLPSSQTPRASTSSSSSILQPLPEPKAEKSLKINKDRIAYWMKAGAQPTESVTRLLTKVRVSLCYMRFVNSKILRERLVPPFFVLMNRLASYIGTSSGSSK